MEEHATSCLLSSIHRKLIDVISRQRILHESPVCDPALKHLLCLIVDAVVIHIQPHPETGSPASIFKNDFGLA